MRLNIYILEYSLYFLFNQPRPATTSCTHHHTYKGYKSLQHFPQYALTRPLTSLGHFNRDNSVLTVRLKSCGVQLGISSIWPDSHKHHAFSVRYFCWNGRLVRVDGNRYVSELRRSTFRKCIAYVDS